VLRTTTFGDDGKRRDLCLTLLVGAIGSTNLDQAFGSRAAPTETLSGLVERVTYHNAENGFCVLRVKARGLAWCRDQGYGRTDPNPVWGQATRT